MTNTLIDPDKPAGWVVSVDDESGIATRNDGEVLQPAAKNPWYVLMTIAGEPKDHNDEETIAANRRYWNGWACSAMSEEERAAVAKKLDLPPEELAPLKAKERKEIAAAFRNRLAAPEKGDDGNLAVLNRAFRNLDPEGSELPDPKMTVQLGGTHFSNTVVLEKWVFTDLALFDSATFTWIASFDSAAFTGGASFHSATFTDLALFDSATFTGGASFHSATFTDLALFDSATFTWIALFDSATFTDLASFHSATFTWIASFHSATFTGDASFDSATFTGDASFADGNFGSTTRFAEVEFRHQVPEFYGRRFHQGTSFTTDTEYWPEISAKMSKDDLQAAKDAYTRLRQVMNELHKPDAEQFFGRQEIRCDGYLGGRFNRWLTQTYGLISDYGFSVGRPAVGLLLVVLSAWALLPWVCGLWPASCPAPGSPLSIFAELGLSFSNTFAFLGFHRLYFDPDLLRAREGWMQWLGAAQSMLGVVLLFFLGLGLRNRFRLK